MPITLQSRHRDRVKTVSKGIAYYSGTGVRIAGDGGNINIGFWWIDDWRRPKSNTDVQPLDVGIYAQTGGQLNKSGSGNGSVFQNWYPTVYDTWNNFPHHTNLPLSPSNTVAATQGAARSNPSRPYVDVPVEILELGDIVSVIKKTGDKLLDPGILSKDPVTTAANLNLGYSFGLAPLVDDLVKLLDFARQFQKRMEEIERLASKKGLRRTVKIGIYGASGMYNKTFQSQGLFYNSAFSAITKEVVRVHCRWKPAPNFGKLSKIQMDWVLRKIMHGLTLDAKTAWEATPFTWLIDYFTNIGDYFKANRNMVEATLYSVHVIRHTKTTYTHGGYAANDYRFEPVEIIRENKTRVKATVAPVAHLPLLTGHRMGILASLFIVRSGVFPR
jgi:hypothetical protein